MLKHYIIAAVRNLRRQKGYAFINIFGLALGIACCLLMALFVKHEWSHDRFHKNKDHIFRLVTNELRPNGQIRHMAMSAPEMPQILKETFPGVTQATGFVHTSDRIAVGEKVFREDIGLVSPDFLSIFTFPLLAGDPKTALSTPDGIVLTESVARKFFDTVEFDFSNVLGQSVTIPRRKLTGTITGIAAVVPKVSSIDFDVLVPIEHQNNFGKSNSGNACMSVYVHLAEHQNPQDLTTALQAALPEPIKEYVNGLKKWNRLQDSDNAFSLQLQPLNDIYWNPTIYNYYESKGNLTAVYVLWAISALVLLIACSNFTTLSIAKSSSRFLEVGMRKVLGANRTQVMQQFWGEALLLSFISLAFGLLFAQLLLPIFNGLVQRTLEISYWGDGAFLLIIMGTLIIVGMVAGSYPALILSGFQPISVMKKEHRLGGRSVLTRILVIVQYTASIALIICTGIMLQQQHYVQNKNLGYEHDHVVVVRTDGHKVATRYKTALLENPNVLGVTLTDRAFTTGSSSTGYKLPDGTKSYVRLIGADTDFIPTLKINLIQGRNFSKEHPSDRTEAVIINETLAKKLNWEDPTGQTLTNFEWREIKTPTIIGVVKDFHIDAFRWKIQPLVLQMRHYQYWPSVMIRIRPDNVIGTVEELKATWKAVASPDEKIRLSFLDENLHRQYRAEQRWQRTLTYASTLAIAISCLGLLGLASLVVNKRTKEIGIRKVLGASVPNLVRLLTIDFVKLLIIANLIACPIAYYTMDKWLTDFAYRIDLSAGIFLLSSALVFCTALFTIGLQTLHAARRNPVDALRYE